MGVIDINKIYQSSKNYSKTFGTFMYSTQYIMYMYNRNTLYLG